MKQISLYRLFSAHLAADEILTDTAAIAPLLLDGRGRFHGHSDIVLQPRSRAAVQTILRLCHEEHIALTPQGGNTGLCGAATPKGGVLLLLSRLNRILDVSAANRSITVEAGTTLHNVQTAARKAGWFFPLSLASEGTCQIGGNLACNAGGINVLRYGTTRDLVLGVEVVLPGGHLISQLAPLHKNTTGLDLKQLFVGSEGTLGIITAATLKLFPSPRHSTTLWATCTDIRECISLLNLLRQTCGETVKSFELLSAAALRISLDDLRQRPPTDTLAAWQVLCELESDEADLADILCQNGFANTLIAQNESQRTAWWRIRENVSEAQKRRGVSIKHDIAVPIAEVADFVSTCAKNIHSHFTTAEIILFGHLGDGSLHYNIFLPDTPDHHAYAYEAELNHIVYDCVLAHHGTIAAEHGIGILKRNWLTKMHTPVAIGLMRTIKQTLDPHGIMNPGKVYPD